MVLSASSVHSFEVHDGDSYAIVKRQLMWVAIGIPCAWVASRLPYQAIRQLSWLGDRRSSVVLLALTAKFGVVVNGNKNWLAARPGADPAVRDRQARDRAVGRPRLRPEGPPARQPPPGDGAGGAGPARRSSLLVDRRPRPRHRPGALRDPAGDALGGRGARPAVHARAVGGRRGRGLARDHQLRAARPAHQLRRPVQGLPRRRLAARPRPLTRCPAAAGSARASAPASRSGATCPRPTPTSSSRCSARSSAWSARCW